jgi:hypothetical protein
VVNSCVYWRSQTKIIYEIVFGIHINAYLHVSKYSYHYVDMLHFPKNVYCNFVFLYFSENSASLTMLWDCIYIDDVKFCKLYLLSAI